MFVTARPGEPFEELYRGGSSSVAGCGVGGCRVARTTQEQ